jgi:hypothetical protein
MIINTKGLLSREVEKGAIKLAPFSWKSQAEPFYWLTLLAGLYESLSCLNSKLESNLLSFFFLSSSARQVLHDNYLFVGDHPPWCRKALMYGRCVINCASCCLHNAGKVRESFWERRRNNGEGCCDCFPESSRWILAFQSRHCLPILNAHMSFQTFFPRHLELNEGEASLE